MQATEEFGAGRVEAKVSMIAEVTMVEDAAEPTMTVRRLVFAAEPRVLPRVPIELAENAVVEALVIIRVDSVVPVVLLIELDPAAGAVVEDNGKVKAVQPKPKQDEAEELAAHEDRVSVIVTTPQVPLYADEVLLAKPALGKLIPDGSGVVEETPFVSTLLLPDALAADVPTALAVVLLGSIEIVVGGGPAGLAEEP